PDYDRAYNNRGISLYRLGRFAEAVRDFDKAISTNPRYTEAYCNRGNTLIAQQQSLGSGSSGDVLGEALANFDRALAIGPEFAELFASRGLALRLLERYEDALTSYEKALALRADFPEAEEGRALCQAALGHGGALNIRF